MSFYVWDYPSGGIGFVDAFWKAAAALDPSAAELDEALRFPFCTVAQLKALCVRAGLREVQIAPIEIEAAFVRPAAPDLDPYP